MASGQVIGLYSLDKTEPGFFTPEHVRLAELLAAQGAIAIQNASLHEQVQRHAAELEQRVAERTAELKQQHRRQSALASIELAINQPHELQAVLDRIVGITKTLLPASDASIILWNEQAQEFSTSASTVAGQKPQTTALGVRRLGGATRWIVDHGQPLTVSDVRDDPFSANPMLGKYGLRAYAGVSLPGDGESLGVLYALDRRLRQYSQKDLDFMAALAGRAALAITKVRLYQELQNSHRLLEQHAAELEIRNEDLDAFAHTVAHDLQNPVAIIIGFGEVLQDETLAEEACQSYLA